MEAWRGGRLGELVLTVLQPLVGERFADFGRAADMIWMGFGNQVAAPTERDPERRCARHRIHVSGLCRLDSQHAIVAASGDIHSAAVDGEDLDQFACSAPAANRFDVAVSEYWLRHEAALVTLTRVESDPLGTLALTLSNGHSITVFPDRASSYEHWRYFEIGAEQHFVVLPDSH